MDYPVPDPAWDYAGIWHSTQQAKQKIEELLAYMAQIEDATPESDAIVRTHLERIQTDVEGANAFLNS